MSKVASIFTLSEVAYVSLNLPIALKAKDKADRARAHAELAELNRELDGMGVPSKRFFCRKPPEGARFMGKVRFGVKIARTGTNLGQKLKEAKAASG